MVRWAKSRTEPESWDTSKAQVPTVSMNFCSQWWISLDLLPEMEPHIAGQALGAVFCCANNS